MNLQFKYLISLVCMSFGVVCVTGQTPTFNKVWDKRFGGNQDDGIASFQLTPDGGFILAGYSSSGISGDKTQTNWDPNLVGSDYWIVKTDSLSNLQWEKRFGGINTELLGEIAVANSGGYLLGGHSYSSLSGDKTQINWDPTQMSSDYWVVRTDNNGTKLWDKRFGGNSYELFGSLKEAPGGSIYLAGSSFSGVNGDKTAANIGGWDFWIVRTNSLGVKIWDKTFGGSADDFAIHSVLTSDGGLLIGGYSNSDVSGDKTEPSRGTWDYWIIKIDSSGNKVWDKTLGGDYLDYLFSATGTSDGGFIVAGQSYSTASGDKSEPNHDPTNAGSDYWIIKLDGQGNKLWDRTYGASQVEQLSRISPAMDGGFILCGESYSPDDGDKTEPNLGLEQTWVVKIDSVGNMLWDKTIFTTGHDELGTALEVSPLCFVAVNYTAADTGGYKSQLSWGAGDYWMVKICKDDPSGLTDHAVEESPLLYPNPASSKLSIRIMENAQMVVSIRVTDICGRQLMTATDIVKNGQETTLDISRLSPGYYFLTVDRSDRISQTVPFVVK